MGEIRKKSAFLMELHDRVAAERKSNLEKSYNIASALLNSDGTLDLQLSERYNHCLADDLYYQRLQRDLTAWCAEAIELEKQELRDYNREEWESGTEYEYEQDNDEED